MNLKKGWLVLKETFTDFGNDNVLRLSAALAYYAIFSIGPLLAIAVGLAGLAFGHESVRHQIAQQLQSMVGRRSAKMVESMMAAQRYGGSLITTIIGIIALLFGAAGVFGQLQDSLNTIWKVKAKPGTGIWGLIRTRFLSLSMVLGTGFLLLISLALTTFLAALTSRIGNALPISEVLVHALNLIVSFAVITLLFAMIFKYLPDVQVPFRYVWVGAIGTALLFTAGKYVLALYLGRESTASPYGAAGSVIIILMWIYYGSLILLFGAEFTHVYARQTGTKILPDRYAVPVMTSERLRQGMSPKAAASELSDQPRSGARARGGAPEPVASGASSVDQPAAVSTPSAGLTPGAVVRRDPWQFLGLMLVAGFAGGALLKFRTARKALRLYLAARKS